MSVSAAVLTGDLVGSSTALGNRVALSLDVIREAAELVGAISGGDARFTRFRGDGWQFIVGRPELAFRAAVLLVARLRSSPNLLPTRIGIGFGKIDSDGSTDLRDASGSAFIRSGRALDRMLPDERIVPEVDSDGVIGRAHDAVAMLLDERSRRWTPEQAEATALFLSDLSTTQRDVAKQLGITPQAANYRLRGAGAPAIREALLTIETDIGTRLG